MILLFQVLSSKHFAPTAHIFVPTELLVRGPGQHRQWPGLAQMVQGRPAPSLGSQQLTRSLETGREIWEEREREIMRWPVSSGMLGMEDRIRQYRVRLVTMLLAALTGLSNKVGFTRF